VSVSHRRVVLFYIYFLYLYILVFHPLTNLVGCLQLHGVLSFILTVLPCVVVLLFFLMTRWSTNETGRLKTRNSMGVFKHTHTQTHTHTHTHTHKVLKVVCEHHLWKRIHRNVKGTKDI
jgi:hypothetical protein